MSMTDALQEIRDKRWAEQKGHCIHCGIHMVGTCTATYDRTLMDRMVTIEHMIPRHMGGKDVIANIFLACHRCNQVRNDGHWGSRLEREDMHEPEGNHSMGGVPALPPTWLSEIIAAAQREVASWPEWKQPVSVRRRNKEQEPQP